MSKGHHLVSRMNKFESAVTDFESSTGSEPIENLEGHLRRRISEQDSEIQSLHEYNAKLHKTVDGLRKQNNDLELSLADSRQNDALIERFQEEEIALKKENLVLAREIQAAHQARDTEIRLAAQARAELEKTLAALEESKRALSETRVREEALRGLITQKDLEIIRAKEDWQRRLAKIADECWNKDLELGKFRESEAKLASKIRGFITELGAQEKALSDLRSKTANSKQESERQDAETREKILIARQRKELDDSARRLVDLQSDLSEVKEALEQERTRSNRLSDMLLESQESESEIGSKLKTLQTEHANLSEAFDDQTIERQSLQAAYDRIVQELNSARSQHEALSKELDARATRFAETMAAKENVHASELKIREDLITRLKAEMEEARTINQSAAQKVDSLGYQLMEVRAKELVLVARADDLERRIRQDRETSHEEIQRLKSENRSLAETIEDLTLKFRGRERELSLELEEVKRELNSQHAEAAELAGRASLLQESLNRSNTELVEKARLLKEADSTLQKMREEIFTIQLENAGSTEAERQVRMIRETELRREVDSLKVEIQRRTEELALVKSENLMLVQKIGSIDSARFEHGSAISQAREAQLRGYAKSMNQAKTEFKKVAHKLASEARLLAMTHPLRDYLKATEHELRKMEVQLKKTPTISPERAKIENCVGDLVDQREFLKTILQNAQTQLQKQADEIDKLATAETLSAFPPPPPISSVQEKKSATVPAARTDSGAIHWERPGDALT